MKKKGFTLIEILAIIIIIGLIIAILAPAVMKIIENTRRNAFRESMKSIIRRVEIYMEENNLNELPVEGLDITETDVEGNLLIPTQYSYGYKGRVIFEDDEVKALNISDDAGRFCGNGSRYALVVTNYNSTTCD